MLVAVVSGLAVLAIIAGALLTRAFGDPERAESPLPERPVAREQEREVKPQPEVRGRRQHRKAPNKKSRKSKRPESGGQVFVATAPEGGGSVTSGGSSVGSESTQTAEPKKDPKPAPPPLPPAPSSYLYHLFNPETGDHFVTVNSGVASEYEGRGLQLGRHRVAFTRLRRRAPKPSPPTPARLTSSPHPPRRPHRDRTFWTLWYASDGNGDFFYSTSKSEASKDGWSASAIGYVRSP